MSGARVRETVWRGQPAWCLDSGTAELVVVPGMGCKIVSLRLTGDEHDFLWSDETRPFGPPDYAGAFGDYDAGGFDECFPTIGECAYPDGPWAGVTMPDHGELWTVPWECQCTDEGIDAHVYGVRLPYRFERAITARSGGDGYVLSYRVTNLSPFDLRYLWSAHPLFSAAEGMRVLMPGFPEGETIFAGGGRIAAAVPEEPGVAFRWPWVPTPDGSRMDYGLIGGPAPAANDKVCVRTPPEGWCALFDPLRDRYVGFRLSAGEVPYIAVCVNQAWWPFEGRPGYWVAMEPCTGYPDPLDAVVRANRGAVLKPRSSLSWQMELCVGRAASEAGVARAMCDH